MADAFGRLAGEPAEPVSLVEGRVKRLEGWVRALVIVLVVVVYLPSLSGSWVWDDHYLLESSSGLASPWLLASADVWGAAGQARSDLYRPLTMLSFWPGQYLLPGPFIERLVNLALHLLAVGSVARLARHSGASGTNAWVGAAFFGVHPGAVEAVAWITGRHDLLPALLVLGAWSLFLARRDTLAGVLLGLAPFAKESYLLVPLLPFLWRHPLRWPGLRVLIPATMGVAGTLLIRRLVALDLPVGAVHSLSLGGVGALACRFVELLVTPGVADALVPLTPAPIIGLVTVLCLSLSLVLLCRWSIFGLLVAPALLLLPVVPAAAQIGLVADRYFFLLFAMCGVFFALGLEKLRHHGRIGYLLAFLPLVIALGAFVRTHAWRDDRSLFEASLRRDPENPYAMYHLAHDLHVRRRDCAAAIPLYRQAQGTEARAGKALQACLVDTGAWEEAVRLGPELGASSPEDPVPYLNTARALALLGRLTESEAWVREALGRDKDRVSGWMLLGSVLAQQGRLEEAKVCFGEVLAREPESREAALSLEEVSRILMSMNEP